MTLMRQGAISIEMASWDIVIEELNGGGGLQLPLSPDDKVHGGFKSPLKRFADPLPAPPCEPFNDEKF